MRLPALLLSGLFVFGLLAEPNPARSAEAAPGSAKKKIRIVLVGDSTVGESSGWGPGFAAWINPATAECINAARNGRSSKSFFGENLWQPALDLKGDYYLIQFGHNDEPGKGPERETDPATTFPQNLSRYVNEARAIGARPILVTSLTRRKFTPGRPHQLLPSLVPYAAATARVAQLEHTPLLDLHARSIAFCEQLGEPGCEALSPRTAEGGVDQTHLNAKGSAAIARLVVEELRRIAPELASAFLAEPRPLLEMPVPAGVSPTPAEPPMSKQNSNSEAKKP
jgi:pectinesterase